jgi:5-dehydro-2-deoxygluconokinase
VLLDGTYGREALFAADREGLWIGRPVEQPGSRPLRFETHDLGSHLAEWPVAQTVKCLCFYHPDDEPQLRAAQEERLLALQDAARTAKRELLIEIIAGRHGPLRETTVASVLLRLYDLGIRPDWWKLEAQGPRGWEELGRAIGERDPLCRGVVVLGLDAPEQTLAESLAAAARFPVVKGFAVGRTIFSDAARRWLAGRMSDDEAVADMVARFERLATSWITARAELNSAA